MTVGRHTRWHWIAWAVLVTVTAAIVAFATSELTGWPGNAGVVAAAAAATIPLGAVVASFDRLLPFAAKALAHTIVAAGLVLMATAVYVLIVIGFEGRPSGGERSILAVSMVAAAVIAVFSLPARRRLELFANEHVYGQRQSPDAALQTLASRMSRAVPMDELMLQLAETLRRTMDLRRAEVWTGTEGVFDLAVSVPDRAAPRLTLGDEREVAARAPVAGNAWLKIWVPALLDGRADAVVRAAPVVHLGALLGFIVAERGSEVGEFDEDHERALTDVARQLGLALHNVRLDTALQASLDELQLRNAELVASRARIVAAADESRREIERNLHDGAQQHLVAMAVKIGLTRQLLDGDPAAASGLVEELRDDVQATLTELRELAHGIYPPLLRSRGLPEALTAAANRATLPVSVHAPNLPRFAADVEAAVYFCCLEAMQNSGKHAGDSASVSVTVTHDGDELVFAIVDDGAGFETATAVHGHGFVNMVDRLGAIGATLAVSSAAGEGTSVSGRMPAVAELPR